MIASTDFHIVRQRTNALAAQVEARDVDDGPALVSARGLGRKGAVAPFDLDVREGEVIGVAGLLGSGRTEMVRLLKGTDRPDTGTLDVHGVPVQFRSPRDAIRSAVVYSSEDRRHDSPTCRRHRRATDRRGSC